MKSLNTMKQKKHGPTQLATPPTQMSTRVTMRYREKQTFCSHLSTKKEKQCIYVHYNQQQYIHILIATKTASITQVKSARII